MTPSGKTSNNIQNEKKIIEILALESCPKEEVFCFIFSFFFVCKRNSV